MRLLSGEVEMVKGSGLASFTVAVKEGRGHDNARSQKKGAGYLL